MPNFNDIQRIRIQLIPWRSIRGFKHNYHIIHVIGLRCKYLWKWLYTPTKYQEGNVISFSALAWVQIPSQILWLQLHGDYFLSKKIRSFLPCLNNYYNYNKAIFFWVKRQQSHLVIIYKCEQLQTCTPKGKRTKEQKYKKNGWTSKIFIESHDSVELPFLEFKQLVDPMHLLLETHKYWWYEQCHDRQFIAVHQWKRWCGSRPWGHLLEQLEGCSHKHLSQIFGISHMYPFFFSFY